MIANVWLESPRERLKIWRNFRNELLNIALSPLDISSELLIIDLRGIVVSRVSIAPSADHVSFNPFDHRFMP